MVIYSPTIAVKVESDIVLWNTENTIQVDAPSFDGLLSDLNQICKEIFAAITQSYVDLDWQTFPLYITVRYVIFSLEQVFHKTFTKEEFEEFKKQKEPDKPQFNPEAIQNDIQYGINMIRSFVDIKTDVAMHGVVSWYHHLLQKHFGVAIPKEILDIHDENMRKLHNKDSPK